MERRFVPPEADDSDVPTFGYEPESDREDDEGLDAEGYKRFSPRQQLGRLLSLVVFGVLFPFVFVALGARAGRAGTETRASSLVPARGRRRPQTRDRNRSH